MGVAFDTNDWDRMAEPRAHVAKMVYSGYCGMVGDHSQNSLTSATKQLSDWSIAPFPKKREVKFFLTASNKLTVQTIHEHQQRSIHLSPKRPTVSSEFSTPTLSLPESSKPSSRRSYGCPIQGPSRSNRSMPRKFCLILSFDSATTIAM